MFGALRAWLHSRTVASPAFRYQGRRINGDGHHVGRDHSCGEVDSAAPGPATRTLKRFGVGIVALALLFVAEFTLVLWLRGLTIHEYIARRDPVAGTVYIVMLGAFAIMPLLLARR